MGAEPIYIPLIVAAIGAAAATTATVQQNQATRRSQRAAINGEQVKLKQLNDAAALERQKAALETEQIRGRLRVAAASQNVGLGGSFSALDEQAVQTNLLNNQILNTNLKNQQESVKSGLNADLTSLAGHFQNTLLSAFQGGLGGFGSGLQIGGYANELSATHSTTPATVPAGVNTYGVGARGEG